MHLPDEAVITSIKESLDQRIGEAVVQGALAKIRKDNGSHPGNRIRIERELSLIESRLRHLVDAIARGQGIESIYETLRAEEERKKSLLRQLQVLSALEQTVSLDEKRLLSVLKERISDFPRLLGRNIPATRQILRKMIERKILCEPVLAQGSSAYRFSATGTYGAVLCPPTGVNDCGGGHPN
jgi:hypothetical protein